MKYDCPNFEVVLLMLFHVGQENIVGEIRNSLAELMGAAQKYHVKMYSETYAVENKVGSGRMDGSYRIVSLADSSCSCGVWQNRGWACIHGVAAFRKLNLGSTGELDLTTLVSRRHLADSSALFYKCAINIPLVDTSYPLTSTNLTYPAVLHAPGGRPRLQKRIRVKGKSMRCSRCCRKGHNAR